MEQLEEKYTVLKDYLVELRSLVIGFSGGVDSTLLVKVAYDLLGDDVLAVTSSSETYPSAQLEEAEKMATEIGVPHLVIDTEELDNEEFAQNPPRRCYHCKSELFKSLQEIADKRGYDHIADGTNYDDLDDFRPGIEAAEELTVVSPLAKAEFTKDDIRQLSKRLGLSTWDKPSFACLSSRFPYGEEITTKKLKMVDRAEEYLRQYEWKQLRVRHHDDNTARIEVLPSDFKQLLSLREKVINEFKEIGYTYVTLDIEGYRTGSMNEILDDQRNL